jgi:serine/threonine protein phosphatase PrpC
MQFTTAALTDIGLVRHENEDRFLNAPEIGLFAVADGIGGLPKGAEAAECAVTTLSDLACRAIAKEVTVDLAAAVEDVNRTVVELAERLAPTTGLGCTLCAGLIRGGSLQLVNVGDSRCYLFRSGTLSLLTTDDTVEQEFEVRRAKGEKVTMDERYRNALTRCIGQPMDLEPKIFAHSLKKGDVLLLCTDGISRMIENSTILIRLREDKTPEATAKALIADAMAAGGGDNATAVVVRIDAL